jgi:hypothetical protein
LRKAVSEELPESKVIIVEKGSMLGMVRELHQLDSGLVPSELMDKLGVKKGKEVVEEDEELSEL